MLLDFEGEVEALGPVELLNTGGGVNWMAGFFGIRTGGWVTLGVKPNWPAVKLVVPPLLARTI